MFFILVLVLSTVRQFLFDAIQLSQPALLPLYLMIYGLKVVLYIFWENIIPFLRQTGTLADLIISTMTEVFPMSWCVIIESIMSIYNDKTKKIVERTFCYIFNNFWYGLLLYINSHK